MRAQSTDKARTSGRPDVPCISMQNLSGKPAHSTWQLGISGNPLWQPGRSSCPVSGWPCACEKPCAGSSRRLLPVTEVAEK